MRTINLLILAGLLGCAAAPPAASPPPAATPVQTGAVNSVVTMVRGPCYGTCPTYSLTVAADGAVIFIGYTNVRVRGLDRAQIDPAAARALIARFGTADFAGMWESYQMGQMSCGLYHTDASSVELRLLTPSSYKKVVHDHGCAGAPQALRDLELAVDSVAGVRRWLMR